MHQIDETGSAARQRNSGGLFSGRRTEEMRRAERSLTSMARWASKEAIEDQDLPPLQRGWWHWAIRNSSRRLTARQIFWPRWALLILGFFCTGITFLTIAAV